MDHSMQKGPDRAATPAATGLSEAGKRLLRHGSEGLGDHELLALWLSMPDTTAAARLLHSLGKLAVRNIRGPGWAEDCQASSG